MEGAPRALRFDADGIELAYFEWGEPDAPVIFLVHATGFHARCWDRTVAALPFRTLPSTYLRGQVVEIVACTW